MAAGVCPGGRRAAGGAAAAVPSPVVAVGRAVIDVAPRSVREGGIETFGTADKPALVVGTVAVALALGALVGHGQPPERGAGPGRLLRFRRPRRRWPPPRDPTTSWPLAAARGGADCGSRVSWRCACCSGRRPAAGRAGPLVDLERRALPGGGVGAGSLAVVAGSLGRALAGGGRAAAARARTVLRRPVAPLAPAPAGLERATPGISPLFTPLDRFYRIDTALTVPDVDVADLAPQVGGMVDRPFSLTYDELAALPQVEADITLCCVSNEVGGRLIGTPAGRASRCATCSTGPACSAGPARWWAARSTASPSASPPRWLADGRDRPGRPRHGRRAAARCATASRPAWWCRGCTATSRPPSG